MKTIRSSIKCPVSSIKLKIKQIIKMEEIGKVAEVLGDLARIEVAEKEVCHKCPSEAFCKMATNGSRSIEAINGMGAKVGDTVKIEIITGSILMSAFMIYIVPLSMLLIAAIIAQKVSGNQNAGIVWGFIAFLVSFIFVKIFDKKVAGTRKLTPIIKEIVNVE